VRYQEGPTPSRTVNIFLLPLSLLIKRMMGYKIFHLHWTYEFSFHWAGTPGRMLSQLLFMWTLIWLKFIGYRLVWTAHNILPHDQRFYDDLIARRFLATKSDVIIIHSAAVLAQMKRAKLKIDKTVIIPHGSYVDAYPHKVSREKARKLLGIPDDAFVYAFVGALHAYKGIEALVASFEQLLKNGHKKALRLVIAGAPKDERVHRYLLGAQQRLGDALIVHNHFIPNEELQNYFASADVVVLPFVEISTSGSAMLALSFGVPIITPHIGGLQDLPDGVGYWYDPSDDEALYGALKKAPTTRGRSRKAEAAKAYAKSLSWKKIAQQTLKTYR